MRACGRRGEAIELAEARLEEDTWYAAAAIGEILAEAGRIEAAIDILAQNPSANSSVLAWHLIDLGRVEDAVAVVRERRLLTG